MSNVLLQEKWIEIIQTDACIFGWQTMIRTQTVGLAKTLRIPFQSCDASNSSISMLISMLESANKNKKKLMLEYEDLKKIFVAVDDEMIEFYFFMNISPYIRI